MKAQRPYRINGGCDDYLDYQLDWELPGYDDHAGDSVANEHSLVVRVSYDKLEGKPYGVLTYEVNGNHQELATFDLGVTQFYRITGHPVSPEHRLEQLRKVSGVVSILDGIATLPDGTTFKL
jgi:hypothetical protein